jgi:hypothetical protein
MARFNSLLGRKKFPVPLRRELGRKPLYFLLDSKTIVALEGPGEFGFRDGFARDCLLQRRVHCELTPHGSRRDHDITRTP